MMKHPDSKRQVLGMLGNADWTMHRATIEAEAAWSQANWLEVYLHVTTAIAELHALRSRIEPLAGIPVQDPADHTAPAVLRGDDVPF